MISSFKLKHKWHYIYDTRYKKIVHFSQVPNAYFKYFMNTVTPLVKYNDILQAVLIDSWMFVFGKKKKSNQLSWVHCGNNKYATFQIKITL